MGPSLGRLADCTAALQQWFWTNDLLLNPDKSDAAFFGTVPGLKKAELPPSVIVAGCPVNISDRLKLLGVTLDSALTFENHVANVVKACNFHLRALRHLRRSLTRDVANTLACSIVGSRIDYCNALLYGATDKVIEKLQRIQSSLARVVCDVGVRKLHESGLSSHDLLGELHWLPVRSRIDYKVAVLAYSGHRLGQPDYLASLIKARNTARDLRSTSRDLLVPVPSRIKMTSRRFSCAAPQVWNGLPDSIRAAPSVSSFKTQLKTHFYTVKTLLN